MGTKKFTGKASAKTRVLLRGFKVKGSKTQKGFKAPRKVKLTGGSKPRYPKPAKVRSTRGSGKATRQARPKQHDSHVKAFNRRQPRAKQHDAHVKAFNRNQPKHDAHVKAFRSRQPASHKMAKTLKKQSAARAKRKK